MVPYRRHQLAKDIDFHRIALSTKRSGAVRLRNVCLCVTSDYQSARCRGKVKEVFPIKDKKERCKMIECMKEYGGNTEDDGECICIQIKSKFYRLAVWETKRRVSSGLQCKTWFIQYI
uniref:Uncharacterized protein n=1 Tax=Anopheles maculatus TaxID=74869 RepID=A0A182S7S5_9DIPT